MKKQKRSKLPVKPLICLMLLALCIIFTSAVKGQAAGKKTVRVTTQEELIEAINNSKVGTIILWSDTRDSITIPSNKNAKSKRLEIAAPCSIITNKAKFGSIALNSVKLYKEAVSGNTIEVPTYNLSNLELAKKKSIKKLILTGYTGFEETEMYSIIRKGAKIKSIVFQNYTGTAVMDKSNRTLTFNEDVFEWGEPTVVTIKFDSAGRMIFRSEDFESESENDTEYTYKYDKNGNLVEAKGYVYYEEGKQEVESGLNTYDKKNRLKTNIARGRYSALVYTTTYDYDNKGRVISSVTKCGTIDDEPGDGLFAYKLEYTYDKKNRVKKKVHENTETTTTTVYEYTEKGYIKSAKETDIEKPGQYSLETYTYDKNGNNIKTEYRDYDGEITTCETTYDEIGQWDEAIWTYPDGEQYTYKYGMAG